MDICNDKLKPKLNADFHRILQWDGTASNANLNSQQSIINKKEIGGSLQQSKADVEGVEGELTGEVAGDMTQAGDLAAALRHQGSSGGGREHSGDVPECKHETYTLIYST